MIPSQPLPFTPLRPSGVPSQLRTTNACHGVPVDSHEKRNEKISNKRKTTNNESPSIVPSPSLTGLKLEIPAHGAAVAQGHPNQPNPPWGVHGEAKQSVNTIIARMSDVKREQDRKGQGNVTEQEERAATNCDSHLS